MKTMRAVFLLAVSPLALCAAAAQAQEASSPHAAAAQGSSPAEASPAVEEIVVTGTRAALESAERIKQQSAVVVDAITADDIGQLPDVSISESLIRIPGVTSNDTVRGSDQVAIRGLGPDLVSTEYNGRILPTADGVTRRVGLAGLPTEGISTATAQKTPDAATIEGGVAGILQLTSVRPLETRRHGLTLTGRVLYSDTADAISRAKDVSPWGGRAEVTYIGRPTDNLGVAFTYAGVKEYAAENGVQLDGWRLGTAARADLNNDGTPDALPTTAGPFASSFDTERHSIIAMAQWDPMSSVRVTVDGLYDRDHYVQRTRRYFGFGIFDGTAGAPTSSTVSNAAGSSFAGAIGGYRGTFSQSDIRDHTYEGGLNVAYDNDGRFKAKLDLSYADAGRDRFTPSVNFENDASTAAAQRVSFGYDIRDPSNVNFTFSPLTADDYNIQQANTISQHSSDKILAARADMSYRTNWLIDSVQWGFRIDHRKHTQVVDNTLYSYANLGARPDLDSSDLEGSTNPLSGASSAFGGPTAVTFPFYDFDKLLRTARTASGVIVNDQFATDVGAGADVREMNYAVYGQANISAGRLTGNLGLRWIHTEQTVRGQSGTSPANVQNLEFAHSYSEFLPSLNLRYELATKLFARFSAYKTISRPVFGDLAVGSAVDLTTAPVSGVVKISRGNPDLQPFTAKGVDLGFEWYPNPATSIAVAGYYKWVDNFTTLATTATTVTLTDGTVLPAFITETVNDPETQTFRGFEVQFRRDFDFLPGIWSALGVQANWNHNVTSAHDSFTSLVGNTVNVLPVNMSHDVVNAQLYYSRGGVDVRAAYRYYTGYSRTVANGYQYQPDGQVDFSAGFNLRENLRLIATATNIFGSHIYRNTADYRYPDSSALLQHYTTQGREITLGLRLQL